LWSAILLSTGLGLLVFWWTAKAERRMSAASWQAAPDHRGK
jgi:hypothetical protein